MPDNQIGKSTGFGISKFRPFFYSLLGGSALLLFWAYMNRSEQELSASQTVNSGAIAPVGAGEEGGVSGPLTNSPRPDYLGPRGDDGEEEGDEEDGFVLPPARVPSTNAPSAPPSVPSSAPPTITAYKDGTYSSSSNAPWGPMTISVTVKNGRWTDIKAVAIPDSPPSYYAVPLLIQQALAAQTANIDGVSGATYTSNAFRDDLTQILTLSKR